MFKRDRNVTEIKHYELNYYFKLYYYTTIYFKLNYYNSIFMQKFSFYFFHLLKSAMLCKSMMEN